MPDDQTTVSPARLDLPGGWYLVRDDDPEGGHYQEWFLSEPGGVWVAKFWDGPEAGEGDSRAFAKSLGVQVDA